MEKTPQTICQSSCVTDVGCVRSLNEDSVFSGENLWLVADGMGGHVCGEIASELASLVIPREFSENGDLSAAIQQAHEEIIMAGKLGRGESGMGTTVVALSSNLSEYQVAWVGDSRAYLWDPLNGNRLTQLSEDHSLIVRLLNSGLITPEEAKNHPQRHMITQCLGSVELDKVQVDLIYGHWHSQQQILLTSDGLTDGVSDAEIAAILRQPLSSQEKLTLLVAAAKEAGGKDNISLVLVDAPILQKKTPWRHLFSQFKETLCSRT